MWPKMGLDHQLPLRLRSQLRQGDLITVTKYDGLARSLRDLLDIVDIVQGHGAGLRSVAEDIETTMAAGRLVFHVFASIAQFEPERISERTKEELEAARKRGRVGGKTPSPIHSTKSRGAPDAGYRTAASA